MFTRRTVMFAALALCCATQLPAEDIMGLPLHIERPSDRSVRIWVGDFELTTAVTAVATTDGIVVIDTTELPALDEQFRELIVRELGRDDFKHLINTHEHRDHTAGNSVYSDCEIIAHELVSEGIDRMAADLPRITERYRQRLPEMEEEAARAESSEERARLTERLLVARARLAALEAGIQWTWPTVTFSDRMTLDMGDTTFELYFAGGVHTAGDIFVFVPEQGLLFTGDTMADVWLTDSPGCMTSFDIRRDVRHDFPLLLANWKSLVDRGDEIHDLITGHWNGDLSFDGFVSHYDYLKSMWDGISQAVAAGTPLDEIRAAFALEKRYPELVGSAGFRPEWHAGSVFSLWCELTGAESAADMLYGRIAEVGLDRAVAECRSAHAARASDRFFLESEFNWLGYHYLGEQKIDEAVAVLELNLAFFPNSWNVYDSLGEASLAQGDTGRAIELYEKSLELNPDNANGVAMLERIQTGTVR